MVLSMGASAKLEKAACRRWLAHLVELARPLGFTPCIWGEIDGLPLISLSRPASPGSPLVYLSSGIHGDEPAGPYAIERLFSSQSLAENVAWRICPLLNPRSFCSGERHTPEGVDLNRDYLAARSAEVYAHRSWLATLPPPRVHLSLHEDWEAEGFYLYEINTSRRPGIAKAILQRVGKVLPIDSRPSIDSHTPALPGLIQHDPEPDEPDYWPEAIFLAKMFAHLSYTFETPSHLPLEIRTQAHVTAILAATQEFLRMHGLPECVA